MKYGQKNSGEKTLMAVLNGGAGCVCRLVDKKIAGKLLTLVIRQKINILLDRLDVVTGQSVCHQQF